MLRTLPPLAAALLHQQHGVATSAQLQGTGISRRTLGTAVSRGLLLNPHRGLYVDRIAWRTAAAPVRDAMRLLAVQLVAPDAIGIDRTAAMVWQLPVRRPTDRPHVARAHGRSDVAGARVTRRLLRPDDVALVDGLSVTTLASTTVSVAAHSRLSDALITLDAALRRGCPREELTSAIDRLHYANQRNRAQQVLELGDPWSESWLESLSRGRGIELGMPVPLCNVTLVFDSFEARVDELWVELGVIGECDGKGKYSMRGGDVALAHWNEKQRHEDLEENGFAVARWGTKHVVGDSAALLRRFHRAVARQQSLANPWPDAVRAELRLIPGVSAPPRVVSEVERLHALGYPIGFADPDRWRQPERVTSLWTPPAPPSP